VVAKRGATPRRSAITFEGPDAILAVENFYRTSEQRTGRYFDLGEDNLAMLIAHPDCDERWLAAVDQPALRALAERETLTRIERRSYQWRCGCSHQKIVTTIAPAARQDIGAVFGDDESVRVSCPRCAAQYVITREAMEACLAQALKR
jgi:molecular chaperone Hsp33